LLQELLAQNGGTLYCNRFKIHGRVHIIDEIMGMAPTKEFTCLAPVSQWHHEQFKKGGTEAMQAGDPRLLIALTGDGHEYYCLDYNGAKKGNPTVCHLELELGIKKTKICSSFDELIAHQYVGDQRPDFTIGVHAGKKWTMQHAVAGVRAIGHTFIGRSYLEEVDGSIVFDQEIREGHWSLRWSRVLFDPTNIRLISNVRLDKANGRWVRPIYYFHFSIMSCKAQSCSLDHDSWLWINEKTCQTGWTIADNDRQRLMTTLQQLELLRTNK
jgi:hypothetical protein